MKCYHTFRYGFKSGTKYFIDHANKCFPLDSKSDVVADNESKFVQSRLEQIGIQRKVQLTSKDQNQVKELCAKWICCDMRPFTIVEDNGFQRLANMFIKIGEKIFFSVNLFVYLFFGLLGSQYDLVDAKNVIPSRHTVGRTVHEPEDNIRNDLKQELIEPLCAKAVTIAPDFWQSKYSQLSYLGLNITYVNIQSSI